MSVNKTQHNTNSALAFIDQDVEQWLCVNGMKVILQQRNITVNRQACKKCRKWLYSKCIILNSEFEFPT